MKVVQKIYRLRKIIIEVRKKNKSIGFVPTMGALHEGHIALIRRARKENNYVVVSIFVNPKQFGPKEDYLQYPRPIELDKKLCKKIGVDLLFVPTVKEMYPEKYLTYVEVEELQDKLEGKFRKGHFRGVTTVVMKLFNIVQPDRAYFGEKDYQQLKIIQKMVQDLNIPTKIVPCKTIREKYGLACSSRNIYLTALQRKQANNIYRALVIAKKKLIKDAPVGKVKQYIHNFLFKTIPGCKIDYISICDSETLQEISQVHLPVQILVAVWVGKTRLIDNIAVK